MKNRYYMDYKYIREINYYETDKMGIVHHSNYIRFLEEARCRWMKELGLVMHSRELGVTEENIPAIADATFLLTGGYRTLTRDEVIAILKESM